MTESFKNTCLAIMQLAMETPKEKAHIMCGWVAHCNHFEVRLFLGGWRADASPDFPASHDQHRASDLNANDTNFSGKERRAGIPQNRNQKRTHHVQRNHHT
jgi:hypothetical protein